jgi:hypothetical protein
LDYNKNLLNNNMAVSYVGPYSPEAYKIANSGGSYIGPYTGGAYSGAKAILSNQGSVLGAATGPTGGGTQSLSTAPFDANASAARSANDAYLSQLNTQYDKNAEDLNSQLPYLAQQKDQAVGDINQELTSAQNQVGTQRTNAQNNADTQIQDAGSIAHSTQAQNRNVLRALGILNSSAAGETLAKPITEFDKQRGNITTALTQRMSELDNFLNDQVAKHQSAITGIQNNYLNLVGNIQRDLRFNDRQRADAINAANAALQQRLADVQTSLLNYTNQVNLQKQQYGTALQGINSYQAPTANLSTISNTGIAGPTQQSSNPLSLVIDPNKRNQLDANTLSGFVG